MYGECHAHIFMNGRNYREAVRLHRDHVNEESIRRCEEMLHIRPMLGKLLEHEDVEQER